MNKPELPTPTALYVDLLKKVLTASIYDESAWVIRSTQSTSRFAGFIDRALAAKSLILVNVQPFDKARREEGRDWPMFGFTMVGHKRLDNVQMCVEDVIKSNVPGDFIETGAWRGGASIFMRALLKLHNVTDRTVWVADSFEGMPVPKNNADGWDLSNVSALKCSLEGVKFNFAKFDLLDNQVKFLKGWFCDTLPTAPVERLAILRLDGDLYSSTMDSLKNLYHKVSKGGYVIVDDYGTWPACRQAVTDFLESMSLSPQINKIDDSGVYWRVE